MVPILILKVVSDTALSVAYDHHHYSIVKYLIEQGANINSEDMDKKIIFMKAYSNGNYEFLRFLLSNKANSGNFNIENLN